ncbi:MAG: ATP-dependent DNA helicase RecG [Oscillospiraceae bacterium]|jgi:ATP-dependent DNA helicase RecG|nr:ATP-dependent DNA helicase RecG [Oscillospiraceae bacterium]
MPELSTSVRYIKGIGEQRAKSLEKLRIFTLRDLISYFPRDYEDRRTFRKIRDLELGETACVTAMAAASPTLNRVRKGMELVKVRAVDETGALDVTFFNQTYMRDHIRAGEHYTFFGKAEVQGSRRTMVNPLVERENSRTMTGRIMPVYPLTAGISQLTMTRSVEQGLAACRDLLPDPLPDEVRRDHQLCHTGYAYDQIHFPDDENTLAIARRRLAFEELFLLAIGMQVLSRRREELSCAPLRDLDLTAFYGSLPFSLTGAQQRAVDEILADLASGRPMNRLVQGDVGSGKTMVAAAAMVCAARSGRQTALMAPTEILAEQHYKGLAPLLEGLGIPCALLTGAARAKERRAVLEGLESGRLQAVIGTHALISPDVTYRDLGLVVTDEQHRFGVGQRSALSAKGERPHLLVMSATPIPRTLALMIYGDLDVSVIDELPPGRQRIDTFAVTGAYRPRIYKFLAREIAAGRQAYMICSMVEENGADDRKAVTEYARVLQEQVFPQLRVACVHGRMKGREKEAVMAAFAGGEADILVSTTVVEVGVDVPNATVMVIEDADRFGLSQLHQLRGRVGRGKHKSYCVLITDNRSEETLARMRVMAQTGDGFRIAEEDLRLRGPGDFFGRRQHGLPALKVADLSWDMALLKEAQQAARTLLDRDPGLEDHPLIAQRTRELFEASEGTMN